MWASVNGLIIREIRPGTLLLKNKSFLISTCVKLLEKGVKPYDSYTLLEKEPTLSIFFLILGWYV